MIIISQSGELVTRLNHSSTPITKSFQQQKSKALYGGVTQLQCLPPLPLDITGTGEGISSQFTFVSSCTLGIVKMWSLVSSARQGEEEEGDDGWAPAVDLLAIVKVRNNMILFV